MTHQIPAYCQADTRMTLRDGLAELRALEGDVAEEIVDAELARALDAHDAVHVLFGCDISDDDEILAHAWMAFGTDIGMAGMHAMNANREHREYAEGFAHGRRLLVIARNIVRMLHAVWRTRRMPQRWPFGGYEQFLDEPLVELRRRFGIRPLIRSNSNGRRGPHHPPVRSAV